VPGCYPTSAQLPLIPLVEAGQIDADDIIVDAKSGVTGAGRSVREDLIFLLLTDSATRTVTKDGIQFKHPISEQSNIYWSPASPIFEDANVGKIVMFRYDPEAPVCIHVMKENGALWDTLPADTMPDMLDTAAQSAERERTEIPYRAARRKLDRIHQQTTADETGRKQRNRDRINMAREFPAPTPQSAPGAVCPDVRIGDGETTTGVDSSRHNFATGRAPAEPASAAAPHSKDPATHTRGVVYADSPATGAEALSSPRRLVSPAAQIGDAVERTRRQSAAATIERDTVLERRSRQRLSLADLKRRKSQLETA